MDKLLTIRIDEKTREDFSEYAKKQGSNTSELVKLFIDRCLDGSIDPTTFKVEKQSSWDIDLEHIDTRIDTRIDERFEGFCEKQDGVNGRLVNQENKIIWLEGELKSAREAIAILNSHWEDIKAWQATSEQLFNRTLPVTTPHNDPTIAQPTADHPEVNPIEETTGDRPFPFKQVKPIGVRELQDAWGSTEVKQRQVLHNDSTLTPYESDGKLYLYYPQNQQDKNGKWTGKWYEVERV
jgi:hypothetical protein